MGIFGKKNGDEEKGKVEDFKVSDAEEVVTEASEAGALVSTKEYGVQLEVPPFIPEVRRTGIGFCGLACGAVILATSCLSLGLSIGALAVALSK